jgi:hypothetical protein
VAHFTAEAQQDGGESQIVGKTLEMKGTKKERTDQHHIPASLGETQEDTQESRHTGEVCLA